MMKSILTFSLPALVLCVIAMGTASFTSEEHGTHLDAGDLVQTFTISGDAAVEATTSGGKINVSGGNG
ncbi:MAG: hypothetical protein KTR24_15570, partial [Saprospiraceae bacterium]|nr:hypothetical protein [Saprospiraceae bacterium]